MLLFQNVVNGNAGLVSAVIHWQQMEGLGKRRDFALKESCHFRGIEITAAWAYVSTD